MPGRLGLDPLPPLQEFVHGGLAVNGRAPDVELNPAVKVGLVLGVAGASLRGRVTRFSAARESKAGLAQAAVFGSRFPGCRPTAGRRIQPDCPALGRPPRPRRAEAT